MRLLLLALSVIILAPLSSCGPVQKQVKMVHSGGEAVEPVAVYQSAGNVFLGEPLAVSVDMRGDMYLADGMPSRVIRFTKDGGSAVEFQNPLRSPGFNPSDIRLHGFFIYVIDAVGRKLHRFDQDGAYRDMLLNFNQEIIGRRISPYGMDVDPSGRVVISDIENHQILLFDGYLSLEVAFGNFGAYPGKLDSPQGVSFAKTGELIVADTGNARVQFFGEGGDLIRVIPLPQQDNPFIAPRRAVIDDFGRLYVADPAAGRLFLFDQTGNLLRALYPAGVDEFEPTDVEVTRGGMVYVTDSRSRSLFVFKVMSY
ncbi:MAG: NHL repeat-containing protein [Candidatus Latescibacterota bacterium]